MQTAQKGSVVFMNTALSPPSSEAESFALKPRILEPTIVLSLALFSEINGTVPSCREISWSYW